MSDDVQKLGGLWGHRVFLLLVGLTLIVFLRGWGLSLYLIFVCLYCRYFARRYVEQLQLVAQDYSESHDRVYCFSLLAVVVMAIIVMHSSVFWVDISQFLQAQWERYSFVSHKPVCQDEAYLKDGTFLPCESIFWGISSAVLVIPFCVFLSYVDLLYCATNKIKLSRQTIIAGLLMTLVVSVAQWIIPISSANSIYLEAKVLIGIMSQSLLLLIWLRLAAK